MVAKRRTVVTFGLALGLRISKVLTIIGFITVYCCASADLPKK